MGPIGTRSLGDLGPTRWFEVVGDDGQAVPRAAFQHLDPPAAAAALRDTVAFVWRVMDAFSEEDERILGHAADPYHRIDVRRTSRHLVVRDDGRVVAETHAPLVLYESGFAPRWYVPREDVDADAIRLVEGQTFSPSRVEVVIDGERLEEAPGQSLIAHGPDRNLSVDEVGGIQLVEPAAPAA
ncbi:MAG: hypothetical protein QOD86_1877 [Miltoncostaeaceae bacterium]|nr:hypothetical protein [Miltoncostaeaceae bacterium]